MRLTIPFLVACAAATQENPIYAAHCTMPARIRLELGDGDGKDNLQTYGATGAKLDGGAER
jgi:hypothetical protein